MDGVWQIEVVPNGFAVVEVIEGCRHVRLTSSDLSDCEARIEAELAAEAMAA